MDALAGRPDMEFRLGRVLTADEIKKAPAALLDASAAVSAYARRVFQVQRVTQLFRAVDTAIRLERPVVSVDLVEITMDLQAIVWQPTPYAFDGIDRLSTLAGSGIIFNWPEERALSTAVRVTYTRGFAEVPPDVIGVVCSAAYRQMSSPAVIGPGYGVASETTGGITQTYFAGSMSGAVYLDPTEQSVLNRYRQAADSVVIGSAW